jgi:tetratricopeptide (TPR) repeat protein
MSKFSVAPATFLAVLLVIAIVLTVAWRPLRAWWADDAGNRALLQGRPIDAQDWFDAGLRYEPNWSLLHEDRGRALLGRNPAAALAEFERAACGAPCSAEEGDALAALGKPQEALDRYLAAKAVSRVSDSALRLVSQRRFDEALALERDLIHRLDDTFVEQANLARSYAALGKIENSTAWARPHDARAHIRQAVAAFATATRLAPYNEGYLLSYAFSQLRYGDIDGARRSLKRLLELHPLQPDAEAALAHIDRGTLPSAAP